MPKPQQQGGRAQYFRIAEPSRAHRPRRVLPHLAQEFVELGDVDSVAYADEITRLMCEPHRGFLLQRPETQSEAQKENTHGQ